MSVADPATLDQMQQVPGIVQTRIKRGKDRVKEDSNKRRECLKFFRGEQYFYATQTALLSQATTTNYRDGSGKPPYIPRKVGNLIVDIVMREKSAAVSRIPNYEVNPSGPDPERIGAARLSGKVLRYGYDAWNLRKVHADCVQKAIVQDEGFAWPYWDSSVGPYIDDGEGGSIGQGEVCVRTFTRDQVTWEPGLSFEDSPWHAVTQARGPEAIYEEPGYFGGTLKPDATALDVDEAQGAQLVMQTDYLQRPSIKFPQGRWLTIAAGKQIVPERAFPCVDGKGNVLDEPVLHRLTYLEDEGDKAMGLVRHLLDDQRTYNETINLAILWMRLALNPQLLLINGGLAKGQRNSAEPGLVINVRGQGDAKWRETPQVPSEIMQLKEDAQASMGRIAAQNDVPSGVVSSGSIQAILDADASRRNDFFANLAEFMSRLGRHCLYLVQRHYTEPRMLTINGRRQGDRTENIDDFMGAQLLGEADVTVLPGSLTPRSRDQITTQVLAYADRGWISPERAMSAIEAGTGEGLIESFTADEERANVLIKKIMAGPQILYSEPPRPLMPGEQPPLDPTTGQPFLDDMGQPTDEVPGWMPRPFDNPVIQSSVFESWAKGSDWDALEDDQKRASMLILKALRDLDAQKQADQAATQTAIAQNIGMANAAKPPTSGMPSMPSGVSNGASGQSPSPSGQQATIPQ